MQLSSVKNPSVIDSVTTFNSNLDSYFSMEKAISQIGVFYRGSHIRERFFRLDQKWPNFKRKSPLRTPIFKKTVKSTGLLKFLVLSDPLNPILKKNWVVTLILGAETGFEIA